MPLTMETEEAEANWYETGSLGMMLPLAIEGLSESYVVCTVIVLVR